MPLSASRGSDYEAKISILLAAVLAGSWDPYAEAKFSYSYIFSSPLDALHASMWTVRAH